MHVLGDPISPELEKMKKPLRVGIAGAGSISLGTAAFLSKNGFTSTIWSPSVKGQRFRARDNC